MQGVIAAYAGSSGLRTLPSPFPAAAPDLPPPLPFAALSLRSSFSCGQELRKCFGELQTWHLYGGLGTAGSVLVPPAVRPDFAVEPPAELGTGVGFFAPVSPAESMFAAVKLALEAAFPDSAAVPSLSSPLPCPLAPPFAPPLGTKPGAAVSAFSALLVNCL